MMNLLLRIVIQRYGASREDVLAVSVGMINVKANGVPQFRRSLPLVNQPGCVTGEQALRIRLAPS